MVDSLGTICVEKKEYFTTLIQEVQSSNTVNLRDTIRKYNIGELLNCEGKAHVLAWFFGVVKEMIGQGSLGESKGCLRALL